MKFDETLSRIGGFGRYQKLLIFGFIIFYPANSWQFICINFLAGDMDHWCKMDVNGVNISHIKELIIPKTVDEFGKKTYSKCEMYDINITDPDVVDLMPTSKLTRVPCKYGWEYDQTEFYSTIVSKYTLVCDRAWLQTIPAMAYVLGSFFGSIFPGYMSHRCGRKWTAVIMIIGQMLCNLGEAFSPYFWLFVGFRFLVGIWNLGAYSAFWILVIESMPPAYRNHCAYYCQLGCIFEFILPITAYFLRNHVHLQIASVGLTIPGLVYVLLLPESPRWLLSRKRYIEYDTVVQKIARINNAEFSEEMVNEARQPEVIKNQATEEVSFLNLLKTPRLTQRTLIVWLLWFTFAFVLYAFGTNIGKLVPGNIYLNMALVTAGSEIPSLLTIWIALFKSGRRTTMIIYMFIIGLCCLLMIPLLMVNIKLLVTISAMIALVALKTARRIIFLYTGEVYPTPARTIGFGTASSIARIAALISTQLALLKNIWFGLPYVLLCVFPIFSSVLAYFLPETKGRNLPETFEEAELFGTPEYNNLDNKERIENRSMLKESFNIKQK